MQTSFIIFQQYSTKAITVKGSAKAIPCNTAYREETHFSGNHSDHSCLILSKNYEAKYLLNYFQLHQNILDIHICFCHLQTKNDPYLHLEQPIRQ